MSVTLLSFFDLIGTIAFAISGTFVGIRKKMDIFGVNVLAVTTACGGGLMRDLIIGVTPPMMFRNPFYVLAAAIVANTVFLLMYRHRHMPRKLAPLYDQLLFWFDSLGLAAFTVDGVMAGVRAGYPDNYFLICFLGFITAVGGGALAGHHGLPDARHFPQAHLCRCRHCRVPLFWQCCIASPAWKTLPWSAVSCWCWCCASWLPIFFGILPNVNLEG